MSLKRSDVRDIVALTSLIKAAEMEDRLMKSADLLDWMRSAWGGISGAPQALLNLVKENPAMLPTILGSAAATDLLARAIVKKQNRPRYFDLISLLGGGGVGALAYRLNREKLNDLVMRLINRLASSKKEPEEESIVGVA